ncbi:MAG: hypothetical protein CBC35_00130 [Planctomycetes bacterium TMED75]|nr:hypothetical protein [Planctomycetaceae bacterium]OUU96938.1 MAG: hypothetical protein CBC35_00130 [Planctomycetes bacterium TMED75]
MTNRHSVFCTALTLATVTAANADLNYDSVSLTAEAYCEHTQELRSSDAPSMQSENTMSASCGATEATSYFSQGENGFIIGAGSTGPNSDPQQGTGHPGQSDQPGLSDNSVGYASVEIEISIDQVTYFNMSRSLAGSTVEVWEGDNMIHSFQQSGDDGGLLPGNYLFKMENNPFEAPAWAQINFKQASGVKGDVDNNGTLDQRDLVKMLGQLDHDLKIQQPARKTKRNNAIEAKQTPRGRCGTQDPQGSTYGYVASKPSGPRSKPGSGPATEDRGSKESDFNYGTPMDKLPGSVSNKGQDNTINAGKGSKEYSRVINAISIERLQGDMDEDGKVTMKDVAKLLGSL